MSKEARTSHDFKNDIYKLQLNFTAVAVQYLCFILWCKPERACKHMTKANDNTWNCTGSSACYILKSVKRQHLDSSVIDGQLKCYFFVKVITRKLTRYDFSSNIKVHCRYMYTVIIQYVVESVTGGKAQGRQKDWTAAEVQMFSKSTFGAQP